jgi:hypothetical protein
MACKTIKRRGPRSVVRETPPEEAVGPAAPKKKTEPKKKTKETKKVAEQTPDGAKKKRGRKSKPKFLVISDGGASVLCKTQDEVLDKVGNFGNGARVFEVGNEVKVKVSLEKVG